MITIKTEEQLNNMRQAGAIIRDLLSMIEERAVPGISTKKLDTLAYDFLKKHNSKPSFLGYNGFSGTLCTSIDEEVVHGIPSTKRILEEGMLLKIDAGAIFNGYHADAARTIAIGKVTDIKLKLMNVCKESYFRGISILKDGTRLGDLGSTIQKYVESFEFSVVRSLVGHGIGSALHEDPSVPNYGIAGRGTRLATNMTIAIEPMINVGTKEVEVLDDGWTIVTEDRMPSAHYENTVIILPDGVEILTL